MRLPDKPSELIRLAIKDLELCEADPRYVIAMGHWHNPGAAVCYVCLAGSVMANTLGTDHKRFMNPALFGDRVAPQLDALYNFKSGDVKRGAEWLRVETKLKDRRPASYHSDSPAAFKTAMLAMADEFEQEGN